LCFRWGRGWRPCCTAWACLLLADEADKDAARYLSVLQQLVSDGLGGVEARDALLALHAHLHTGTTMTYTKVYLNQEEDEPHEPLAPEPQVVAVRDRFFGKTFSRKNDE